MQDGKKDVKDEQGRLGTRQTQSQKELTSLNPSQIKSLQAELQDSEALYRALFDNANDTILLMKADRIIDCNPKTLEMFGCTKEQIIGKTPHGRFSPKLQLDGQTSKDKVLEKIRLVLEGQPQFFEWSHLRYDGTPFEAEVSLNRVTLSGNIFIQAFVRNITKRKQAQILYEMILGMTMDGFWVNDSAGNILEVNDAYCNLVGYSREEFLSMNIADVEASESPDQIKKHIQDLTSSNSHRFETRHRCKDGTLIDLDVSANILENDGQRFFAFFRDITERKRTEETLRTSEKRYRSTLDNMLEGCQIIGRDWRYLYVNNAIAKQGRQAKEELLGNTMLEMYPGIENTAVFAILRKCMEKRITHRMENEFNFPDGSEGWFELSIQPVPEGIFILSLDITERKKAEEELLRERDKAQKYLDVAGVIFLALDEKGIVTLINHKGCDVLGYKEEDIINRNWFDNFLPKRLGQEVKTIFEKLKKGELGAIEYFENPILTKEGQERQIAWHNTILKDENGNFAGTISSGEDITERKKAEAELLQARQDWENIFQAIGQPSFILDPQHKIITANRAAVKKTGIALEQLKGKQCSEFLHRKDRPPKNCPMEKMLCSGCLETVEMEIEAFGGTYLVSCTPVCDNQGRLEKVIHIATDITERKLAEETLSERIEQYERLEVNIPGMVYTYAVHPDGSYSFPYANQGSQLLFDIEPEEFMRDGTLLSNLIHPDDKVRRDQSIIVSIKTLQPWRQELRHIVNGEVRWYDCMSRPQPQPNGDVLWDGIMLEITNRKKVEQALEESEKTARALLDATKDSVLLIDRDGLIIDSNDKMASSLGKTRKEILGTVIYDHLPPDLTEKRKALGFETIPKRQTITYQDQRENRWFENSVYPILNPQGEVVRFAIYSRDITDRKDAERKLQKYQEQLKSLALELSLAEERERRRIATGIHDDIAQRLALAKFELKSIQKTISDTDVLSSLESQCDTMDRIMEDARSLTFELSNPLLYEIGLEAAIESFLTEQIQEKNGIKCTFTSQGPQIILNEEIRVVLYQGVRELSTNIIKYAHASHVDVRVMKSNNQISIVIQDDGIGFNVSKLSSPDRDRGGFGLFNIRERLEHLDGTLNIQSTPNSGTCVTMSIPLKSQAAAQEKEILP